MVGLVNALFFQKQYWRCKYAKFDTDANEVSFYLSQARALMHTHRYTFINGS